MRIGPWQYRWIRRAVKHLACPFAALFVLTCAALPASATIRYEVSLALRAEHLVRVRMSVPEVREELVVQLPAWNALYQIRDFAHHVQRVRASDSADRDLPVTKRDKLTWRVAGSGTITLDYSAYWDESGAFSAQLNDEHAFLNLALVLFYVPARRAEETRIEFVDVPENWRIAVALAPANGSGTFRAASYDALVDAPAEAGQFEEFRLEAGGARIRVVVHGSEWQRESLEDVIRRVVAYQTALMRDVPFSEYLFIYHLGRGGGGMEHANSTAIHIDSDQNAAGITAHEFFHLWDVKRIRPQSLEPVDYTRENWTRALWFAEGVTSTYGSYTLVRTELWSPQQFYEHLAREITQLEARPARLWQSVEQASLDAWHEKYPLHRQPGLSISYYNKGEILGLLLDVLIRDATHNTRSLDDMLRYLNENFARRGRFYKDSTDIRAAVEKITGRSFAEFFAKYVSGTGELPCREILSRAGLLLKREESNRSGAYAIEEEPGAGALERRIRDGLLRGTTDRAE